MTKEVSKLSLTLNFKEYTDLVDIKYDLKIALHKQQQENIQLKQKLLHAEKSLHIADVKLDNAEYEANIFKALLEEAREQTDKFADAICKKSNCITIYNDAPAVSSVQAVAKIESKDDLKEVLQDEHMSLQLSLYTQEKECYSYEDMKALDETKETINKISNALETYNYSEMLKTLRAL